MLSITELELFRRVEAGSTEEVAPALARLAQRITNSRDLPSQFDNCAGSFKTAEVVLIGEKPAFRSSLKRTYPFMDTQGCSKWLTHLLDDHEIDETKLFWLNGFNSDGTENTREILPCLTGKRFICLGKMAEKWATRSKFFRTCGYDAVPHPQFWKRFKSKEQYPLIELLMWYAVKETTQGTNVP